MIIGDVLRKSQFNTLQYYLKMVSPISINKQAIFEGRQLFLRSPRMVF
jgi:hypothetical protein